VRTVGRRCNSGLPPGKLEGTFRFACFLTGKILFSELSLPVDLANTMDPKVAQLTSRMDRRPRTSAEDLRTIFSYLNFEPPVDYVEFMSETNGSEGPIGDSAYLAIYSAQELLDCNGQTMELEPGILFFATDRGGTGYAFELDRRPTGIVAVEFADLDRASARAMGRSLLEFLQALSTS
jgi:hypothetical protein